jgi:HKD family nuclease
MKVQYKSNNPIVMETWINEQEKGNSITIKKGYIFETSQWGSRIMGVSESVVTDKNEWMCDVDCKEFNELFDIIEE